MNDSPIPFLIGVDGGGTGCRAVIGTPVKGFLAQAVGGRANATTDLSLAIKSVLGAIHAAADLAGIALEDLTTATAHIGLAGVLTNEIADRVAAGLPFAHCTVTDDCPTAVMGALDGADGCVAAIGTGSFIGASRDDACRFVGGYGFQLSDQASGAWLGRAALKQALKCHDRLAAHSDLTRDLMARFGNSPADLVTFAQTARPGDYGGFAPDVMRAAVAGDTHGLRIVNAGATYIANALDTLGFATGDTLCLMGGVGPHYRAFLPDRYTSTVIAPKASAVEGAFHLARIEQAGAG